MLRAALILFLLLIVPPGWSLGPRRLPGAGKPPTPIGTSLDGDVVHAYELTNTSGASARILTLGAALADLRMPDRAGQLGSVVHAAPSVEEVARGDFPYFGVIHGRFANRIARGRFVLDGKTYQLVTNGRDNAHHIHGGAKGFAKRVWRARFVPSKEGSAVELTLVSPDGDEGYPGRLVTVVRYTLTPQNVLRIDYSATTDRATPINLTHHAFFDLDGNGRVADQQLHIAAERYTVFDEASIPTGEIASVAGTPLDFRQVRVLAEQARGLPEPARFNHNFALDRPEGAVDLRYAARLQAPGSGRILEVWTTEPGLQLFTSNLGNQDDPGREGRRRAGFVCLETQHFPDSVNHPHFPSTILRPGETFRSRTEFRFFSAPDQGPVPPK